MEEKFNRFFSRFEVLLAEPVEDEPAQPKFPDDKTRHAIMRWYFLLMTSLLIALIIDIAIIFTVPEQWTRESWFWMKEPISLLIEFLIATPIVRKVSKK